MDFENFNLQLYIYIQNGHFLFEVIRGSIRDHSRCFFHLKGTVDVIESDPSYEDGNARFTTAPLDITLVQSLQEKN